MYCKRCGVQNPDEAKFCRNCGGELHEEEIKEEAPKKAVIEEEIINQNTTSTTDSKKDDSNSWIGCCLCLISIFIIFSLFAH